MVVCVVCVLMVVFWVLVVLLFFGWFFWSLVVVYGILEFGCCLWSSFSWVSHEPDQSNPQSSWLSLHQVQICHAFSRCSIHISSTKILSSGNPMKKPLQFTWHLQASCNNPNSATNSWYSQSLFIEQWFQARQVMRQVWTHACVPPFPQPFLHPHFQGTSLCVCMPFPLDSCLRPSLFHRPSPSIWPCQPVTPQTS